jgi:VanZ family protein
MLKRFFLWWRRQHSFVRRLAAVGWGALITVTLLQSSEHPLIGPGQPPGPVTLERELFLTAAHVIAFAGLLILIWAGLYPARRALMVALVFCFAYGIATELLQTLVIDRGASLYDLFMNFSASSIAALLVHRHTRRNGSSSAETDPI